MTLRDGRFIVPRKLLVLRWAEGTDLEGAVVRCAPLAAHGFAELGDMEWAQDGSIPSPAELSALLDQFSTCLGAWNLSEEDGSDIPACRSGVGGLPLDVIAPILAEWLAASQVEAFRQQAAQIEADRIAEEEAEAEAALVASLGVEALDGAEVLG